MVQYFRYNFKSYIMKFEMSGKYAALMAQTTIKLADLF